MTAIADLKHAHRATWAAGNYAAVAERIDEVPPAHLLGRVPVAPGDTVLDVAAGTGNVTIRAAPAGATVVGLDLTPELFTVARRRAEHAGVHVDWVQGDAEDLPFARRLLRRDPVGLRRAIRAAPPGRRARAGPRLPARRAHRLVNWTPDGFIGQFFRVMSRHLPALPAYASAPPLWGDEGTSPRCSPAPASTGRSAAATTRGTSTRPRTWSGSSSATTGRPSRPARAWRPRAPGTRAARELVALAEQFDEAADGELLVRAEYLVATGTKPA